jgi:hypothetical protein
LALVYWQKITYPEIVKDLPAMAPAILGRDEGRKRVKGDGPFADQDGFKIKKEGTQGPIGRIEEESPEVL